MTEPKRSGTGPGHIPLRHIIVRPGARSFSGRIRAMTSPDTNMRKIIIAGTYAQYMDWLALHKANRRAAPYVHEGHQLRHFDPTEDEIVLVGTYHDNPAYQSPEYLQFIEGRSPVEIAV